MRIQEMGCRRILEGTVNRSHSFALLALKLCWGCGERSKEGEGSRFEILTPFFALISSHLLI